MTTPVPPPNSDSTLIAPEYGIDPSSDGSCSSTPAIKTRPCSKFFSTAGCPFGESCHFLHYVGSNYMNTAAGAAANARGPMVMNQLVAAGHHSYNMSGSSSSISPAMAPAAGLPAINGYKTRLCNRFNTPEGCRFGAGCHFAHGEAELRPKSSTYIINYLNTNSTPIISNPNPPPPPSSTNISVPSPTPMSSTSPMMPTLEVPYPDYRSYYSNLQPHLTTYPISLDAFGPPPILPPSQLPPSPPNTLHQPSHACHEIEEPTPPGVSTMPPPCMVLPTAHCETTLIA